jgi:diguanylate cyclase (GGDEF)-like protein/PAS domain S-box-containing protein
VLLALIALIIASNIAATEHEHDQAVLANIAARQRTLVERYTKDVLLVSRGSAADPNASHEVLRETIHALLSSGEVSNLQGSSDLRITVAPATNPRVRAKLTQERRLIDELNVAGEELMALDPDDPGFAPAELRLRIVTALLSSVSNDVLGEMTHQTQASLSRVVLIQLALGVLIAVAAGGMAIVSRREGRDEESARFQSLVNQSSDLLSVVNHSGTVVFQSPSSERLIGRLSPELVGSTYFDLVHPDDVQRVRVALDAFAEGSNQTAHVEYRVRHSNGSWRQMEATITDLSGDAAVAGLVLNAHDVTDRKALETQLSQQAFHDSLTGLANRALLGDRIDRAVARHARDQVVPAVLLIDLDGFKTINDSLGHGAGDEVLVAVARCLETCVRPSDTVARLGGDEFAILIEEGAVELATGVADRILQVLAEPLVVAGRQLYVNASIGVTLGGEGRDADVLVRDADVAMYAAKARGKGRYEVFQPHMHAVAVQRQELLGDLQQALEKGQFSLVYQPVFDLESRRMDGWEALLRWDHPTRGQVPPLDFIAIAEETGLIVRIGRWVLRKACRQAAQWQQRFPGAEEMTMSVNISARQLKEPSLVEDVRAVLADTGLDPRTLMLEITESSMLDLDAVRRPLDELKALGVGLALDDFGTGYSSLGYLRRFPIDTIKIDKSFVDGLVDSPAEGPALLRAIARLGPALGLRVVAEGAEQQQQLADLMAAGCDAAQGFILARPMDPEGVEALLSGVVDPATATGSASAANMG